MKYVTGINDVALLRALAQDIPDIVLEVRNQLEYIARSLEAQQPCTSDEWLANCPQEVRDFANKIKAVPQTQEPHVWMIQGSHGTWKGEYAEMDAKAEAKRCGGTCYAYPLYTAAPQPAQDVLETNFGNMPELSDNEILTIAHRKATRYTHVVPDGSRGPVTYGFSVAHMLEFARAIEKEWMK